MSANKLLIISSIVFILCLFFWLNPFVPEQQKNTSDYMFHQVIKWPDRSREHVEIGNDGYFVLDGQKKRLVGMTLGFGLSDDKRESYWLPRNLERWDRILDYLEDAGVRIVSFEPESIYHFGGEAGEEFERYSSLLDLIFEHKMMVIPLFEAKHQPDAGDLSNPDFDMAYSNGTDTVGKWAFRFAKVMDKYPNVVSILVGNELNIPFNNIQYDPDNVSAHIVFIKDIIQSVIDVPVVTSFAGYYENDIPVRDDIIKAGLDVTDWPCFTIYGDSLELYNERITILTSWLQENGYPHDGYWVKETNYYSWSPPDASKFSVEYLDSLFAQGASIALLYAALSEDDPGYSFFDRKGYPIESMQRLVPDIERLQLPLAMEVSIK